MENVKKVKAGELAIRNNDSIAVIRCLNFIWPNGDVAIGSANFYTMNGPSDWIGCDATPLPTILATELLKEIEAGEQTPESRISELTAQKEAIEAEIEKLKAESKKFNAERALAGEPCETMRGEKVLAIHRNPVNEEYPLYALLEGGYVQTFTIDGFLFSDKRQSSTNLKMS